ncbi:MAG: BT0820 family HAD-type phosphatase [Bacteroidota bacterium]
MDNGLRIAVDFDGTIVEHAYPDIGKPLPGAFETLISLTEMGHKIILWTFRDGDLLQDAVEFCMEHGLMFWAINQSFPDEEFNQFLSRKIIADVYIDDRNFGGFPGWDVVYKAIADDKLYRQYERTHKKRGWFGRKLIR